VLSGDFLGSGISLHQLLPHVVVAEPVENGWIGNTLENLGIKRDVIGITADLAAPWKVRTIRESEWLLDVSLGAT